MKKEDLMSPSKSSSQLVHAIIIFINMSSSHILSHILLGRVLKENQFGKLRQLY